MIRNYRAPIMEKVSERIYVGNAAQADFLLNVQSEKFAFLHCAKTYHQKLLNYRGNLNSSNENYLLYIRGNRAALNLVDMNYIGDTYFDVTRDAFEKAFAFLDQQLEQGKSIFIHCDQGESRGPFVALLYIASKGEYNFADFDTSIELFKKDYRYFVPVSNKNIYVMVESFWEYFIKKASDLLEKSKA